MERLEPVLKQKFWILLGVAILMTFIGWWMATSEMKAAITKRKDEIENSFKSVPSGTIPNESWSKRLAVVNTAQVRVGSSVAVIGLGGVGLAALIGAHAAGARQIIAVDLSDDKLEQARSLGATHTINAKDPEAREKIRTMTSGGVEYAFEFAGSIRALELAYAVTRRGGSTVTAGLPPSTATFPLPAVSLVAEERTLKGSYIGTCVPSRDIPRYIDLYMQGRLPVNKLLSGRLTLDQINHGFDLLHEGKAIRQVVVF